MNLDMGILWIEDSFSNQEKDELQRRVRGAGFIARIDALPNGIGIEPLARRHQLYHVYDLILLDYHLKDEHGDELASKVRALFPSTTILFYSGSAEEPELRRLIADKEVEGVYCSARGRFIERAGSLIDQTARSLDRLSGMRGLAMRVVAECDEHMKASVLSMSARDPACAMKIGELDEDVLMFLDGLKQSYQESLDGGVPARLGTRAVDSAKLFKHFRRLTRVAAANPATFGLNQVQVERLRELRARTAQYDPNVLRKRNILGHVTEIEGENGWTLQGSDEITAADFPEIRQSFAAHIADLREARQLVTVLDDE